MHNKIYDNITELIGNTPLVRLGKITEGKTNILAKLEMFNPLSSIKDRVALSMIEKAEKDGKLKEGYTIIEATSGNTGVGISFVASVKGYNSIIVMPDTMSAERRRIIKALGAKLVLTPGKEGMKGALKKAGELLKTTKNSIMLQQFENPANPEAHKNNTATEIWNDTEGKVDIVVCGVGTGGTLTGLGETLKKLKPGIKMVAVEPDASPVLSEGKAGTHKIQGIGAGFIPEILNTEIIDEVVTVSAENAADTARKLASTEGIFAGISSGAAAFAALQIAKKPENVNKLMVVILPDTGERYLSTFLYSE